MDAKDMKIGHYYNWIQQKERLIYLGYKWSSDGYWHQFALREAPHAVWCEVKSDDLFHFEATLQPEQESVTKGPLILQSDALVMRNPERQESRQETLPAGTAVYTDAPNVSCSSAQAPSAAPCTCPSGDGSLRWPCPAHPSPAEGDEPLFLLHCGQIDSSGEQDDWETEADSSQRVEEFCRLHPGQTVKLYPHVQPKGTQAGMVLVNAAALNLARNCLKRDAEDGKQSRREILELLDEQTFDATQAPAPADGPRLAAEARVGNTTFGVGVPERMVIEAAQRAASTPTGCLDPASVVEFRRMLADNAECAAFLDSHLADCEELSTLIAENEQLREQLAAVAAHPARRGAAGERIDAAIAEWIETPTVYERAAFHKGFRAAERRYGIRSQPPVQGSQP